MRIYPFFLPQAGCPHRCVFCCQSSATAVEQGSVPADVAASLSTMLLEGEGGEVAFYGGTFTLLKRPLVEELLGSVLPFLRDGRIGGIRLSTRPDALGPDVVECLVRYGVTTVEIGCQSFDRQVLKRSGRGHGPREAEGAVCRLKAAGIRVGLQLMPGLPGGDRFEAERSLETAIALGPDFLRIYPAVVFSGTALAKDYLEGRFEPWSLDEAVDVCSRLWLRCRRAGIPVVRIGLQNTVQLDLDGAIIAGPYHGAFGQLVRCRCWLLAMKRLLGDGHGRHFKVHGSDLSDALGHRRGNLSQLEEGFGPLSISADPGVPRGMLSAGGEFYDPFDLIS